MPQQKKRKSAEEILGIAPPPRKSAEEILGISAPAPAQSALPPEDSFLSNLGAGIKQGATRVTKSAISAADALGKAAGGDFRPLLDAGELALRGAMSTAAYISAGAPTDPKIAEVKARQEARRATDPDFQTIAAIEQELAERAARNPSFKNKAARFVGSMGVEAIPYIATGAAGGGLGAMTAVAGAMSAGEPETAALNMAAIPALGAAGQVAGKFIAPVLRRIRGGSLATPREFPPAGAAGQIRATGAVAEQASIRGRAGVAQLEPPPATQTQAPRESYRGRFEDGPPKLEVGEERPFGVSLGKERASTPGAKGPRYDEAVELELRKSADPSLATKAERTQVLELISAARKAGMLTGPQTHLKNIAGSTAWQLGDEVARIPGAVVDMLVSRVTGRRALTGPSLGSMGRSAYEAATMGISEARRALKTGQTKYDLEGLREIASGSKVLDYYVNRVFRSLKAEDAVFKAYAIRRSLEDRARALALTEARQGKIPRGQIGERTREILKAPPEDMASAAALDAEVATFNNPNALSGAVNRGVGSLPRGAQFAVDLIVPFRKTPTNVIARMLESSPLGFGKNAVQLARAVTKKSFTEAEQRAFSQTFGRASAGSALVALGYIGYRDGWLTGLQEDDPGRRARDVAAGRTPGAIRLGNTWYQLAGFAPLGNLLAIGASLARETAQEQEGGVLNPALEVFTQAAGEQPLLIGTQQIASALRAPGTTSEKLVGGLAGSFVPTIVSNVAEAMDSTQREAKGITGQAQKRIPGLRNLLPEAVDTIGQPKQDFGPGQAMLDPTRATTAVERQNPLFAELVRLDAGISGFDKTEDETDDAYRAKTRAFGQLYTQYGRQLVSSPQYQRASDEIKLRAVKRLNQVAKSTAEEGKTSNGALTPAALVGAAMGQEARENRKKRGK